jgi:hypothetical protein
MIEHTEVRRQRGRIAAVAVVLVALATISMPDNARAFSLPTECSDPTLASFVWGGCLLGNTCGNGFKLVLDSEPDTDPSEPGPGPFAKLATDGPHHYRYTYGNTSTGSEATMKIKRSDLDALPGWRAHAIDTLQTVDVVLDGPWRLTRASEPTGLVLGGLRFTFTPAGVGCVVPVHRE